MNFSDVWNMNWYVTSQTCSFVFNLAKHLKLELEYFMLKLLCKILWHLNHLLPLGNLGGGVSLLTIWHCANDGVFSFSLSQSCLSYHFNVCIFSFAWGIGVTQLFSGFLSLELAPGIVVCLVGLWEDGNWGAFCIITLILSPGKIFQVP